MVIKLRFGIGDGSERTLEEVGTNLFGNPGTNPPDRSQGSAKIATSFPQQGHQEFLERQD